ncbi:MAG TPA: Ig-like domain-containing protein [Gemmatimonadaceae bacterium]
MKPRNSSGQCSAVRFLLACARAIVAPALIIACTSEPPASIPIGNGGERRIVVEPSVLEIQVGNTGSFVARAYDTSGAIIQNAVMTWTSSNTAVATISSAGLVTGVGVGNSTLTASSNGTSATAEVRVSPAPVIPGPSAGLMVYPNLQYQTMIGWQGTVFIGQTECNRTAFQNYHAQVIQRLVNELGINSVRMEVRSGHENPVDHFSRFVTSNVTSDWFPYRYESINDNSDPRVANPAGFQFAELSYDADSVVQPLRAALQQRGERLYVTLTYVDFKAYPWEQSSNPEEYAELILAAFKHLQARNGWVPDAVEVILEPDNTTNWTPEVIARALVAAGDRLKAAGFRPAFIAPGTTSMSAAPEFFDRMMSVPRVLEYLTDISYHRYRGVSASALAAIAARAKQYGIRTAMLEHIGADYHTLHEDIRDGQNSTWQQYVLAGCFPGDNGGKYYVIDTSNPQAPVVTMGQRARFFRQYFLYVREGAVRIGATSTDARFDPLAFRNANGKLVVVSKVSSTASILVGGLAPGTYGITYAAGTESVVPLPDAVVSQSGTLQLQMPTAGVITVFQR